MYREKDLITLEFDKFLEKLSSYTLNEKTKERLFNLKPSTDIKIVKKNICETQNILNIFYKEGYIPISEYPDISKSLELLVIEESILSPKELLDTAKILNVSRNLKKFLSKYIKENECIQKYYKNLFSSREIEGFINDSIDKSGMVKDNASRDLHNIRKHIKELEKKIHSILENILHSFKYEDVIQDKIITIRKERFVIPVKPNFSSKIQGIIHDRSSSGQTVYLEPVNIVELNNKLSDLKIKEHIEIRRILKFLTDILRNRYQSIKNSFESIIQFDFFYTLAKFGKDFNCVFPEISNDLELIQAKHPLFLLDGKKFNPIDIKLNKKSKGLVLTGSNTGGKTVALKTAGLLALLFQSGIPIPVNEESKIPIFDWVYSDIGDMQSIELNLSTYSAHIINIKEIMASLTKNSLVLLDELIPGTDPDEGAALGIGVMKKIKEIGAYTIITTHFKQIKLFALSDEYFEIASVGFDKNSLSPTYTIHYKSVGQSMAFYIAEKIGFDKDILEIAKNYLDNSTVELNKAIEKLERYKEEYEREAKLVQSLKKELKELKNRYNQLVDELEKEKKERWKGAVKEIDEYIESVKKEGYKIIEEVKREGSGKKLEKYVKTEKERLTSLKDKISDEGIEEFKIGDKVRLKGKNTEGEIISIRENKANVNFKGLKVWVNLKDLQKVEQKFGKKRDKQIRFNIKRERKAGFKPEISLIGKTKEEALKELADFLDRAILDGYSTVRIIHGYGAGILRKAVREYLDKLPYTVQYEDAPYSEGGLGVTIAHIK